MKIQAAARLSAGVKETKAAMALIEKKLAYYTKAVHEMEGLKNNPTARDVYHKAEGKRETLEAVKKALEGKPRELDQL